MQLNARFGSQRRVVSVLRLMGVRKGKEKKMELAKVQSSFVFDGTTTKQQAPVLQLLLKDL